LKPLHFSFFSRGLLGLFLGHFDYTGHSEYFRLPWVCKPLFPARQVPRALERRRDPHTTAGSASNRYGHKNDNKSTIP
jgi:hypothetical protein